MKFPSLLAVYTNKMPSFRYSSLNHRTCQAESTVPVDVLQIAKSFTRGHQPSPLVPLQRPAPRLAEHEARNRAHRGPAGRWTSARRICSTIRKAGSSARPHCPGRKTMTARFILKRLFNHRC
uniref:(northern house mosquito) hypothetical protein n=1 Tax=Culex pipiens TaxID=7175 RepID=A0A8D8FYU4_CULPI